jgi:hypothetical protein
MPRPHPPEFRQRAVELARMREKPVAQIAEDLGISDSCLRKSMRQADIDEGRTSPEGRRFKSCPRHSMNAQVTRPGRSKFSGARHRRRLPAPDARAGDLG